MHNRYVGNYRKTGGDIFTGDTEIEMSGSSGPPLPTLKTDCLSIQSLKLSKHAKAVKSMQLFSHFLV